MDSIQKKMMDIGKGIGEIDKQLAQLNRRQEKLMCQYEKLVETKLDAKATNDLQGKTPRKKHTEEGIQFI